MEYKDLLLVFANSTRIRILLLLGDNPLSSSQITIKIGNISNSEVSRHLKRLIEVKLIERNGITRNYSLTSFGKIILQNFIPLDFLFHNADYFISHNISDLPLELTKEIFFLQNAEIIVGTGHFVHKISDFMRQGNKFSIMSDSPFPGDLSKKKKVDLIIPQSLLKKKKEFNSHLPQTPHLRVKYLKKIPICLCFSDLGEGFVIFPSSSDNKPDFGMGFYVTDKPGINYLKRLWNYFWLIASVPSD